MTYTSNNESFKDVQGRERADKFLAWVSHHEPGRRAAAAQLLEQHHEIASYDVYTAADPTIAWYRRYLLVRVWLCCPGNISFKTSGHLAATRICSM